MWTLILLQDTHRAPPWNCRQIVNPAAKLNNCARKLCPNGANAQEMRYPSYAVNVQVWTCKGNLYPRHDFEHRVVLCIHVLLYVIERNEDNVCLTFIDPLFRFGRALGPVLLSQEHVINFKREELEERVAIRK